MAEEKDVDALINEAEELLNECRKNATDNDIFPKEIQKNISVSGKTIKPIVNYNSYPYTMLYVVNNGEKNNNFNLFYNLKNGKKVSPLIEIDIQKYINKDNYEISVIAFAIDLVEHDYNKHTFFRDVKKEDIVKTIQQKAVPVAESYVKECQELIKNNK